MAKNSTGTGKPRGRPRKPPESDTPGIGHNGDQGGITDAERGDLFIRELAKLAAIKARMATLNAEMRNQRKLIRKDGFSAKEIDYALWIGKAEEADVLEEHNNRLRVARWLQHPVGTQSEMFQNTAAPRTTNGRDPEALGRIAGAEGNEPCKPPPNLSQDDAQRWITGWQAGQKSILGAGIRAPTQPGDFE